MQLRVGTLAANRTRDALSVLCRAFEGDPVFSHYFPDWPDRRRVFSLVFQDLIAANRRFGSVYSAEDGPELIAAAIWRTPSARMNLWDRLRASMTQHRLSGVSRNAADQLGAGFEVLKRLHPPEPHWYLAFVGVAPHRQGGGVGAQLLAPVLTVADHAKQPCYLETPFPETHAFYSGLGFNMLEECSPFVGAPPVWRMLRPPKEPRPAMIGMVEIGARRVR